MSYQQPPGQPPQGPPPYYGYQPPVAPTSSKATTSLVLGVLSLVLCGLLLGIPAMIVARQAKKEIRGSGGQIGGDGVATAGFVTGLIGTIWSVLLVVAVIGLVIVGASVSSEFSDSCTTVRDDGGVSVTCG